MKPQRMAMALAVGLAATLATTGCSHHYNGKVTDVQHPAPTNPNPAPDFNTKPLDLQDRDALTSQPVTPSYTGGPIDTSTNWDPTTMDLDPAKLAAYTVHFKYDSAVVEDSEQGDIASVSQALAADANAKLLIEGNCDERGTEEYNRSLGERRALALREALAKIGVDASRIRTISYGKDKPVDLAHDDAAWAKNRRGDFVYCLPKNPVQ